jgi:transcriptional regulator with XRE-family HTH domain
MKWNEQLKQERNLQGWTQTILAKKLGTNTYTVSRWERGTAFPSLFYRQQLSRLFGKSLEQLGLIPELESRRTQHRHAAEPEPASIQQAEHIAEPKSDRPQHQHAAEPDTVSVQQTAHIAELDTNLCSERPFSNEGQRSEATHIEFVPRNASWYEPVSVQQAAHTAELETVSIQQAAHTAELETVSIQQAAHTAELETVSIQQAHAAKPESCNTQRKWTSLDSEYESNEEDAIKALFTSRSDNHFKLLTEKPLPKEPHKSFPDLNLSWLWLVILLSSVISLATILSFHAFMPSSSPGSMKAGEICLAVHPPSLPSNFLNSDAATAPMNTYEATRLANILISKTKAFSHSFLFFLFFLRFML